MFAGTVRTPNIYRFYFPKILDTVMHAYSSFVALIPKFKLQKWYI